jgi:hypothetical protein
VFAQDLALTVRHQLVDMPVPFCAFNGGADVFVDIGAGAALHSRAQRRHVLVMCMHMCTRTPVHLRMQKVAAVRGQALCKVGCTTHSDNGSISRHSATRLAPTAVKWLANANLAYLGTAGNKSIGLHALMKYIGTTSEQVLV